MRWTRRGPPDKPSNFIERLIDINDSIEKNVNTFVRMVLWALKDTDPDRMSRKLRFAEKQLGRLNDPLYIKRNIIIGKLIKGLDKIKYPTPELLRAQILYLLGIDSDKAVEVFEECLRERKGKA